MHVFCRISSHGVAYHRAVIHASGMRALRPPELRARKLLYAKWDGVLPVPVDRIAPMITRTPVEYVDRDEIGGADGEARVEMMDDRPTGFIRVANDMHIHRKRFTIAHELGHLALGHARLGEEYKRRDWLSSLGVDEEERDANLFAAEFLMPAQFVEKAFYHDEIKDIAELARLFFVSEVAMLNRLQSLGLLP
ncbi:MAG: ImmA/IrrE family metallo-endopeptidase [Zetaproteobacteria bacterium]|nr:MAG: ImmA/IrrE family metallo-endopeptidase [Zetaproteobacteria bacterium]